MKKTGIWLVHLGYWALFGVLLLTFFFFVVYAPAHSRSITLPANSLINWIRLMTGFAIIPGLLSFYAAYTYLFNRFLSSQRFIAFVLTSIITAFLAALCGAALSSLPFLYGQGFLFGDGMNSAIAVLMVMTIVAWINGIIGAIIKGCITWYTEIRLKETLKRKNLETELALVKSQIDPHFLFNTINNIDVLITRDPAKASAYLNKLSGIMRFLLYETKHEQVPLSRELDYLQQYVDLQKIRTSNSDYVQLSYSGNPEAKFIAPMILLPFVENAFKHTEHRKPIAQIRINLEIGNAKLIFTCTNTLVPLEKTNTDGGLGNTLVRKRLELLYPDRHILTISNEDLFEVRLELSL